VNQVRTTQPECTRIAYSLLCLRPDRAEALSDDARLTSDSMYWCMESSPASVLTICEPSSSQPLHHIQGFVRRRALCQNSSHRDYARSLASVPSATPAHRRGTHFLATSAVQQRHRHLKHCSNLIFFAKFLTLFRTFKFYIVRRLCPKFY